MNKKELEQLELMKKAHQKSNNDIAKAYTQSSSATSGITAYDLEAPAKSLFPVMTPLRNSIARLTGGMGIQANWRAVTGINTSNIGIGLSDGQRGYVMNQSTKDYIAKFAFFGLNNSVSFEADYASQGFEDLKALASKNLLQAVMIQEELLDMSGNNSLPLGTTPTPTLTTSTSGGSLPATTSINVYCVALSQRGWYQVVGTNNGLTNGNATSLAAVSLQATFTLTDTGDNSSNTVPGGIAQKSAVANITTGTGSTNSISASVNPIAGAFGYAWFWGTTGNELLGAVTSINAVSITATATGTQNISSLPASDNSFDNLVYDGILTQCFKSGSGSYVQAINNGTLTSDGAGGVNEIDQALASFWNNYRLSPDIMYVSGNVQLYINKLVILNSGAPLVRYQGDFEGSKDFQAGTMVTSYLNKITGQSIQIKVHPNAMPGSILFYSSSIPYPVSDVGNVLVKKLRRDYFQIEWPFRTRKYEFGVYFDGVLQNYFPPAFGVIYNINENLA